MDTSAVSGHKCNTCQGHKKDAYIEAGVKKVVCCVKWMLKLWFSTRVGPISPALCFIYII